MTANATKNQDRAPFQWVVDANPQDIEMGPDGTIYPALYVRRRGKLSEHQLEPHPTYAFDSGRHGAPSASASKA